jgi:hypothetical protein
MVESFVHSAAHFSVFGIGPDMLPRYVGDSKRKSVAEVLRPLGRVCRSHGGEHQFSVILAGLEKYEDSKRRHIGHEGEDIVIISRTLSAVAWRLEPGVLAVIRSSASSRA